MSLSIYQASIPTFLRTLGNLSAILKKAAAHAEAKNIDPRIFIDARLAPDMFPLARQVQIASDAAKGAGARLAGLEVPSYADTETTFDELQARIARTVEFLEGIREEQLDGAEERNVTLKVRGQEISFNLPRLPLRLRPAQLLLPRHHRLRHPPPQRRRTGQDGLPRRRLRFPRRDGTHKDHGMDRKTLDDTSKFLSYVLRHQPEAIGLKLDDEGWADIDALIAGAARDGCALDRALLGAVVENNDKKRFALSADGQRIRAVQGHSHAAVAIAYAPAVPPAVLYHGTASRFLDSIRERGLVPGSRHHVHLSARRATALEVYRRYGSPVLLEIDARDMHLAGHLFHQAENGVWLTERVPVRFIREA